MVLWGQSVKAPSHPVFLECTHSAVNVLAEDQVELSNRFARWDGDKFAGTDVSAGIGGVPLLAGCAATFECSAVYRHPGGDHIIFVGKVERFSRTQRRPLTFAGGRYRAALPLETPGAFAGLNYEDLGDVHAVRCAVAETVALAQQLGETIGVAVWGNHGPTMLRWEQSGRPVAKALRTGLVLPVLTSATGLLVTAYQPADATRALIEAEAAADPVARVTCECLSTVLSEIWERGYASVRSRAFPDMYGGDFDAVSVPVRNGNGEAILAITAIKRSDDPRPEWTTAIAGPLREVAKRVSRLLGYRPVHDAS